MERKENKSCNALVPAPRGTTWPPPWLRQANGGPSKRFHSADHLSKEWREYFEERAAFAEFDGHLPREEAERVALADTIQAMKQAGAAS